MRNGSEILVARKDNKKFSYRLENRASVASV